MANRTTRHFAAKLGPGMVVALALLLAGCASGDEEGEAVAGGELVPATAATEGLYASFFDAAVAAERGRDFVSAITFYNSLYQRDPYELKTVLGLARNFRYVGAPERAVTVLNTARIRFMTPIPVIAALQTGAAMYSFHERHHSDRNLFLSVTPCEHLPQYNILLESMDIVSI